MSNNGEKKEEILKEDVKLDEKGRIIVGENVKIIINANIDSFSTEVMPA